MRGRTAQAGCGLGCHAPAYSSLYPLGRRPGAGQGLRNIHRSSSPGCFRRARLTSPQGIASGSAKAHDSLGNAITWIRRHPGPYAMRPCVHPGPVLLQSALGANRDATWDARGAPKGAPAKSEHHPHGTASPMAASGSLPAISSPRFGEEKKTGARFPERLAFLVGRVGFEPTTN